MLKLSVLLSGSFLLYLRPL